MQRIAWHAVIGLSTACLALSALRVSGPGSSRADLLGPWCVFCVAITAAPGGWLRPILPMLSLCLLGFALARLHGRGRRTWRFTANLRPAQVSNLRGLQAQLEDLGVAGRVRLVSSGELMAFCYGFLRPRVCVSTGLVESTSPGELRAILLHERHHMQRFDPLATLLVGLLVDLFFFFPVVVDLRDYALSHLELAADRAAIRSSGRRPLAGALVRVLSSPEISAIPTDAVLSSLNATRARVNYLLEGKIVPFRPNLARVAATASALSMICLVLMAVS